MPVIKKIKIEKGIISIWKWTELPDQLKEMYPEYKKAKEFLKIKSHRRQIEWLTTRILLKNLCPDGIQLYHNDNGKPTIKSPDFSHISISHSKNMAGIFLSKKSHIGLDIENSKRNFTRITTKYLSKEELSLAGSIPNGFGLFWCIKEAAFKISNNPASNFIRQIKIMTDDNKQLSVKILSDNITYPVHYFIIEDEIVVYLTGEDNHF
ncbi:MAG: 4'-phosphopantetheinyl transferase superfamily protein [Prolixibacteraceae bacterium]|nr:4'-phosphopantetheinyl transferase superfamily protein [Prolixibacteraceae bacterium]